MLHLRSSKTPREHRSNALPVIIVWGLWALCLLPAPALAQTSWREAEVVRLARARAPDVLVAEAAADLADARAEVAGLRPDPALSWEREALVGDGGGSQDVVQVTVPLELSGRRRVQRLLARAASATTRAEAAELRAEAVERAVLAFYAALAAQQRAELLAETVADLE